MMCNCPRYTIGIKLGNGSIVYRKFAGRGVEKIRKELDKELENLLKKAEENYLKCADFTDV